MGDVGGVGVDEFAGGAEGLAVFLEFDAVVGGVGGVALGFADGGGVGVDEIDGGIVFADVFVGGVLFDEGQDGVALFEELGEAGVAGFAVVGVHEAEGVAAVFAVGGPLDELFGVERGLGSTDGGAGEAGGFAGDGVGGGGVGHVVMEGEVEAGAGSGGTAAGGDAVFVDLPFGGFAADELEGAGGVFEGPFDGRGDAFEVGLPGVAVVDGDDGDAGGEAGVEQADADFVTGDPAAAVDVEKDGGGSGGIGAVEVEDLAIVGAVGDVSEGGWALGFGRGFWDGSWRWGGSLGLEREGEEGDEEGDEEEGAFHGRRVRVTRRRSMTEWPGMLRARRVRGAWPDGRVILPRLSEAKSFMVLSPSGRGRVS